ncbi:hypothetical protein NU195Hw_g5541t1 [Hortaea werneckii]
MRSVLISALAAVASLTEATALGDKHFPVHGALQLGANRPQANRTHVTNRLTGRPMRHFTPWHNGTHFTDPATNRTTQAFECDVGTSTASKDFMKTIKDLHLKHKRSAVGSRAPQALVDRSRVPTAFQVPVHIHVITGPDDAAAYTQQMANSQVGALNEAYNQYGISFRLVNTTFTQNAAWAFGDGSAMDDAKKALRSGTYKALNLYFHSKLSGGALGTCTLPSPVQPGTPVELYYMDGCNINAATMPGGSLTGYNLGKTAVHETGHWLGLLHTFEGYSCSGDGDMIDDTPMEAASTNGCPVSPLKNSCPGVSTGDPIHNYMDYSTDSCYSVFTNDQVQRMGALWTQYRASN